MDSEAGVFTMAFGHSGTKLITAEADKTIKLYREDDMVVGILLNLYGIYIYLKVFVINCIKTLKFRFLNG